MTEYSYTDAESVAEELQTTTAFASNTIPSLSTITEWITQESEQVNHDAQVIFGETQYTSFIDYKGEETLTMRYSPIISVEKFEYATVSLGTDGYPTYETKTEDSHFTVYDSSGEITILFNTFSPKEGLKRFKIDYKAGFATVPLIVKKLTTKMVAMRVLNTLINQNLNDRNDGGSINVGSIAIVEPANYGIGSYKQLKIDIEELKLDTSKGFGVYRYERW